MGRSENPYPSTHSVPFCFFIPSLTARATSRESGGRPSGSWQVPFTFGETTHSQFPHILLKRILQVKDRERLSHTLLIETTFFSFAVSLIIRCQHYYTKQHSTFQDLGHKNRLLSPRFPLPKRAGVCRGIQGGRCCPSSRPSLCRSGGSALYTGTTKRPDFEKAPN